MEAKTYNQEGKEVGTIKLSDRVFGLPWNADLVNQVVLSMMSSVRKPYAHTKGRGEVSGGGKKPWRQKGTGRARHGSSRSPIWKGGGVTHGPLKEKDYGRKVNRAMKAKAVLTILSEKMRQGEILFVDNISLSDRKTKEAQAVINTLSSLEGFGSMKYRTGSRALISLPENNKKLVESFRNIPSVSVEETRNLSPVELLRYKYLVIAQPEKSLEVVDQKLKARS